jgi:hypothetical protein
MSQRVLILISMYILILILIINIVFNLTGVYYLPPLIISIINFIIATIQLVFNPENY